MKSFAPLTLKVEMHDIGKSEMRLGATKTQCGRDFEFALRGHHLNVTAGRDHKGRGEATSDWFTALTDEEIVNIFNKIMAQYRNQGQGVKGFKSVAMGVVENPDPLASSQKRHLLYIGANTYAGASNYFKDCAEQNMLNSITNAMDQKQSRTGREPIARVPKKVYVMAGSPNVPIACPCGKCVDTFAGVMPEDGAITILPVNNGEMQLKINANAEHLEEIGRHEAWQTTIGNLNRLRTIMLDDDDAVRQKEALMRLVVKARDALDKPDQGAQTLKQLRSDAALIEKDATGVLLNNEEQYRLRVLKLTEDYRETGQRSIPELDATIQLGLGDIKRIDTYAEKQVEKTFISRLHRAHREGKIDLQHDSETAVLDWCEAHMDSIRCTLLQLNNDAIYPAFDSDTFADNAYPNAGPSALNQAVPELADYGVVLSYTKEINVAKMRHGMMPSAPKEELERQVKRCPDDMHPRDMFFYPLPYHGDQLDRTALENLCERYGFGVADGYRGIFNGDSARGKMLKREAERYGDKDQPTLGI